MSLATKANICDRLEAKVINFIIIRYVKPPTTIEGFSLTSDFYMSSVARRLELEIKFLSGK